MKLGSQSHFLQRGLWIALFLTCLIASPSLGWQSTGTAMGPAATLSATEREEAARVKTETIREVTTTLASDEMQGRGTATPGGDRAAKYLADRFAKLGLKPLGDAGTYFQAIKFKSTQVLPESSLKAGDTTLKLGSDFVVAPPYAAEGADVSGGLIFAGYGVASDDLKRDDFAGLDVKDKIVMVIVGRPKNADEAAWSKVASRQAVIFGLIKRGAAGIIIANIGSKEQPYSLIADYLTRRRAALEDAPEPPFKLPPIILVSDEGVEKIFAGSNMTYAQAKAKAESGEFASRDLNKTAAIAERVKREEGSGSNVVGMLEGSDAKLKDQAVVYTAHYDAYGMSSDGRIYHGAADNALGVGELMAIAEAFTGTPTRPRRSMIFLAVTGEEYGLLGAEYWVHHPTWPIEKVAADLNFDGIGTEVYAPVKRIVGFGMEYSDLGPALESVVTATGESIAPDPLPEEKAFYRSDHYAFVKRGVPALMLLGAPGGDTAPWLARAKRWLVTDYHQPTDTVRPDWNWDGARTLAVVGLILGERVANTNAMPAWLTSSPFNHPRGTDAPSPSGR